MADHEYGPAARFLHRTALGWRSLAQASHEIETVLNRNGPDATATPHVFVCGLARAGTTILFQTLYDTGAFCALTYRDMPFVLMPTTWSRLSSMFRKHKAGQERAHGDGMIINYDSPEAFDEVFWKIFCGDDYVSSDHLTPHAVDQDTVIEFRKYIANILRARGAGAPMRYLSKNNNNLLRLQTIETAFPNSSIVIPFRDPVQQAISLRRQHMRFRQRHQDEPFVAEYMNWLGHWEFGQIHKPFRFSNRNGAAPKYDPGAIEYWLRYWIETYDQVIRERPANALLICYEMLCDNAPAMLDTLFRRLQIDPTNVATTASIVSTTPRDSVDVDPTVLDRATHLYQALRAESFS